MMHECYLGKMLRYLAPYTLCDATLVVFLVSWFVGQHVLFIIVIKSTVVDSVRLVSKYAVNRQARALDLCQVL